MRKILLLSPLLAFLASYGHCQEAAKTQSFEVASITPCQPGTPAPPWEHNGMVQFIMPGGRFTARSTTIKFLIEWAYGILPFQHSGGPAWLSEDRYDVLAKADGNPTDAEMKRMVQKLLTDRFQLKYHSETKDVPILVLTQGKTPPKLFPPKEGEKYGIKIMPKMGEDGKVVSYHTIGTRFSFAQLNLTFSRLLDRIIVNKTGLDGDFDFEMDFTPDDTRPNPLDPSIIITGLREQLGFVVKAEKGPAEIIVIDNAEKVTAGN